MREIRPKTVKKWKVTIMLDLYIGIREDMKHNIKASTPTMCFDKSIQCSSQLYYIATYNNSLEPNTSKIVIFYKDGRNCNLKHLKIK